MLRATLAVTSSSRTGTLVGMLAGLMAREMGGGRSAQVTAALAVAIGPVVLAGSALFQYVAFDFLWWVLIAYLLLRLSNTDDTRWWLGVGAAIGLAVETKYTIGFCVAGVVLGLLLARPRDLRSPWLWVGVSVAVLLALPNLAWQAHHEFISLTFLRSIHERDVRIGRTAAFLRDQFTDASNPVTVPLWVLGLLGLLRSWKRGRERLLACVVLLPFVLFWLARGRGYYVAPLYPLLLAAGAVTAEAWVAHLRPMRRRFVRVVEWMAFAVGASVALIALPIAPVGSALWRYALANNEDLAEEIGWPELVQTVAGVYASLPADERAHARVITGNYGEAGAVDLYSPDYGLPEAISGVNSYWARGYGDPPPSTVIALGMSREYLATRFSSCTLAAKVPNPLGVRNEETERHPDIFLCHALKQPWPQFWPEFRHFG